jgi:hypothetical protein
MVSPRTVPLVVLLAIAANAYPVNLECAADEAHRLQVGKTIMGAPVQECYSGAQCPLTIGATTNSAGTTTFKIVTTSDVMFVARIADGAGTLSSQDPHVKVKCAGQLYSIGTDKATTPAGTYELTFTPSAQQSAAEAGLTVGYASSPTKTSAPFVIVETYPRAPAPAPTPPAKVTMKLLKGSCKGVVEPSELTVTGKYTLRTVVAGAKGFAYNCDVSYDLKAETTDKDCTEWVPKHVVDGKENLDIKLEALDANGKLAMCMKWQLQFNVDEQDDDAWYPTEASSKTAETVRESFRMQVLAMGSAGIEAGGKNNTPATRNLAVNAYLDSMTHLSHKCVPKAENDMLYWGVYTGAFPPQAAHPQLLRVGHKLLAVSSMIYSIDRACTEAWNIPPLGSCVPSVPGVPHCHTSCLMTWKLGPGGVASWGMFMLNHHIPSPTFALVQQGRVPESHHGNLGCGGGAAEDDGYVAV